MRLGDSRRESDFEINVIPLIDVLLTLLMFFVLTTTFVRHASMKVELPTANAKTNSAQTHPLVLMIDRAGHYYVGGHEVLGQGEDALRRAIVAVAGSDRDRPVSLRADAKSSHQSVVTAMDVLGQLGFSRLSIATTQSHASAGGS
ncbi:MAG TPA: biopolymer transporter ExbD [Rhodanobacteraceae bacterium]|nr:biopolymer transporter ExbD [Rhodanobacteraceae bacterium]